MSEIGYGRVSSRGQSLEIQQEALKGCDKLFVEKGSAGTGKKRPELDAMLEWIREGDTVVVTKLDRLARSMFDFQKIWKLLQDKGANLVIKDMNMDTSTETGRFILNILMSVAEYERALINERTYEGRKKAEDDGVIFGRERSIDRAEVVEDFRSGMRRMDIAAKHGCNRSTVRYIIKEAEEVA